MDVGLESYYSITSGFVKIEGDLSVDSERKVIINDAQRERISARMMAATAVAAVVATLRGLFVLLHLQVPSVEQHRFSFAHTRKDLGDGLVRVPLREYGSSCVHH